LADHSNIGHAHCMAISFVPAAGRAEFARRFESAAGKHRNKNEHLII
jgi:hypothetical protein